MELFGSPPPQLVWGFVCQALCGNDPRGARPLGAKHRAATLYSVGSVLDPDHEAVIRFDGEAPGGGPILPTASKPWSCSGHRHLSLYGDLYVKLSVGTTRGEPAHWARSIAPRPCIRLDPCWTRTMKQSFPSTARLRGGGPILPTASKPWSCSGHRHLGSSLTASRESAIGRQSYAFAFLDHQPRSGRRPQHNADRDFAGHDQAPQRDQQFPSECHDHRRLAHALRAFGPRPIPLRQCAVLLEP